MVFCPSESSTIAPGGAGGSFPLSLLGAFCNELSARVIESPIAVESRSWAARIAFWTTW